MNDAANHLNDAVTDCGGSENEECANDILATIDDVTEASTAITNAVLDCQNSGFKCTQDILMATKALSEAGLDILHATQDC